ncbi:MAG: pseudouridine synthase, partial [Gemmatimonadota bacterium]
NRWIVFHKPLGVVTTASDEEGRKTVYEFVPKREGLRYVGRLDVMTTGLLLMTTDGEAIHRLTHPSYRVPRHYTALVHGPSTGDWTTLVKKPIAIDGRPVRPTQVRVRPGTGGRSIIDLVLIEGRNNIVRKWVAALGGKIERLARLSYGPIRLGELPVGDWRPLKDSEVRDLYRLIKLPVP